MAFGDLVTCPRCSAKVHNQKAWCHNCAYPLTPADSTRAPLHGGRMGRPKPAAPPGK
jgi:predicted amidophosphoribosyltransferase